MTIRRRLLILATTLGLLLVATSVVPAAGAQEQDAPTNPSTPQVVESWALAPGGAQDAVRPGNRPNLTYSAPAGSSLEDMVTLFNYSTVPLTFRIYGADAFNTADGGFDVLAADQPSTDVGSWVSVPMEELTLQAGEQVSFPITIAVPADASPGDHVGALIASSRAEGTGADGKVVALDRRTGTRIYLRVDGPIDPRLEVEDISTSYSPALNPLGGTAEVTYTVANRGNVRLAGSSHVTASGPFGLMEARSDEQDLPELLPGESITYTVELDGVPAGVVDTATVHLDPAPIAGDSDSLEASSQSSLTLAVPWTVFAVAVIAGLVLFAWRRYRRHHDGGTPGGGPAPAPRSPADTVAREHQPA